MADGFIWFNLLSEDDSRSREFYSSLLGWQVDAEGMVAGENGPFAQISRVPGQGDSKWVPYAQVDDVEAAAERARKLGAEIVKPLSEGPAGRYVAISDPGGGVLALWQPAAA